MIEEKVFPWWHPNASYFGNFYMDGENVKDAQETLKQKTQNEVAGVIKFLNLKKGARILDVPCGYGRHSVELAKKDLKLSV